MADLVRKLPLEYAVEMNRLIDLEMEGSVGWVWVLDTRW
jgi:Fe-S cluster assembly scaffold protein SufB